MSSQLLDEIDNAAMEIESYGTHAKQRAHYIAKLRTIVARERDFLSARQHSTNIEESKEKYLIENNASDAMSDSMVSDDTENTKTVLLEFYFSEIMNQRALNQTLQKENDLLRSMYTDRTNQSEDYVNLLKEKNSLLEKLLEENKYAYLKQFTELKINNVHLKQQLYKEQYNHLLNAQSLKAGELSPEMIKMLAEYVNTKLGEDYIRKSGKMFNIHNQQPQNCLRFSTIIENGKVV